MAKPKPSELAARCHEIQVSLGRKEVPEFERLVEVGMAVRLALHIRGLPLIEYEVLKLVASHFLDPNHVGKVGSAGLGRCGIRAAGH
jgi:hypothetical protein